jgi:putative ABC transport system permease protein
VDALQAYQRAARLLTILLYAFAVPVMGLVLAFIGLVSNLSIERKQNEIAVTRSRGAAKTQIVSSIALEGLLLGGLALLISLPAALGVTRLMSAPVGWQELSRAFQQGLAGVGDWMRQALGSQPGLQLASIWNSATLRTGVVAVVINLIAMILPALGAARYTIVSYKRERARSLRPPWWQRAWLDVLLFLVAAYGAYQLTQQGSMVALMVTPTGQVGLSSPMSNPLLFLVPSLIVFAFSLFLLRFVPALMALLAWLFSFTRSVGLVLATRHLSRSPATYRTPLIILVFTLSLSAYTASLARTLDHHLVSQTYYQVGADMKFLELGDSPEQSPMGLGPQPTTDTSMQFVFLPVSEYLKIEGIQQVSRVGRFPAAFRSASSGIIAGTFFGIDRTDFPGVAFWRADFAAESLGALMNRLALTPNGVLVPQSFLSQHQLKVGDSISLAVDLFQQDTPVDLTIVGVFDLFPTWYPESGPLFVGNLDYFFTMAGGEFPYHVWMKLDPKADPDQIASEGLKSIDLKVITWEASQPKIDASQNQPERQGVLGLLTLGFVASSILTVLSFLLYALFSYQRRFIELGVMRANGLSLAQMATYMAIELGFLIGLGGAMGTGFGVWTSHFFIPFLQIGADAVSRIPPFQIFIDWTLILQIYGFFAALFVITLVLLVILLLRMKIFQAVKMGEVI